MLKKKWKMEFVSAENPSREVVKYKKLSLAKLEEASKKLSTELMHYRDLQQMTCGSFANFSITFLKNVLKFQTWHKHKVFVVLLYPCKEFWLIFLCRQGQKTVQNEVHDLQKFFCSSISKESGRTLIAHFILNHCPWKIISFGPLFVVLKQYY